MIQSERKRWWALAGLLIAVITVGFDIATMNVASARYTAHSS